MESEIKIAHITFYCTCLQLKVPEINCSVAEITHYNVTVITKERSTSKNITEETTYLSNFLLHQSNFSYTVIVAAINSQGSSERTSKTIGKHVQVVYRDATTGQ